MKFRELSLFDYFWINGNQWMKISSRTAEGVGNDHMGPMGRSWDWFSGKEVVEVRS